MRKKHFYRITEQRSMCQKYANLTHTKLRETFFLQHLLKALMCLGWILIGWRLCNGYLDTTNHLLSRKPRDWASSLYDRENIVKKSANSGLVSTHKTRKKKKTEKLRQALFCFRKTRPLFKNLTLESKPTNSPLSDLPIPLTVPLTSSSSSA